MPTSDQHETLGSRLLGGLARRGQTGALFNYTQRQQLRQIDDRQQLRSCLAGWRLGQIDTAGSEQHIIDALWNANTPARSLIIFGCVLDILSIAVDILPIFFS